MAETNSTTRQDLPDWARPYGGAGFSSLISWLFPNQTRTPTGNENWPENIELGAPASYDEIGGPLAPFLTGFNQWEQSGQQMALNQILKNQPVRDSSQQWMLDTLGGPSSDLARQYETYMTGGPVAGASRLGLMDALTGRPQEAASQSLLDAMYGGTANQAQQAAYNTLGNQRDLATDASTWSYAGPLAGQARQQSLAELRGDALNNPLFGAAQARQMDTIQGGFLSPESNPYLQSNLDTGLKSITDAYRYATAPSTAAQFARSGSFGGSAHQQTQGMQQFEMGRNLTDFANQFLGDNFARERQNQLAAISGERGQYAQERANQLGALGQERGYTQSALEAERGRQYGTQENALQRALQGALDERGGWRSMLDNQLTRGMQASEGELGRGVQAQSLVPDLMQSTYQDADVLRSLGSEYRNFTDAQNQINYQNQQQQFQWPFRLYDIIGSGLASFTGGGGVTTQTSSNPNALSSGAQGAGLGMLGVGALSNLGSWLYPQQQQPAAVTT